MCVKSAIMDEVVGQQLPIFGMWLSLVERCVRDAKAAGSTPVIPTRIMTTGSAGGLFGPYKGPLPAVRLKTR